MAKKNKNEGKNLQGTMGKSSDMMVEVGTELGLTEQPKVSRQKRTK
ncbi:hypothetical protein [Desulforamulus aeronauticus]|uniref:Uncharacterized protein n=1 Tax=Desulforamulus aeronauticus DSM 10349 TaxID=1121421 RepID=A0A1M6XJ64_9FIRM|nr:hypothetical protein [Desulforamulus aeronauticus]SHL05953.1 hypothetical protein SAMN02745123_04040 [Desulforamulus aeronauticus DSM 10349]